MNRTVPPTEGGSQESENDAPARIADEETKSGIDRGLSMSPFYRRSYIIVSSIAASGSSNLAVSSPRRKI